MTRIAFLGLGAMGGRMARRLLDNGHDVTVWNRTVGAADGLIGAGAKWAESPYRAAEGAELVISMVRDDEASMRVWCHPADGALKGMENGAVGIECSTLTVTHVRELAAQMAEQGVGFLDAPVAGSRPQAKAGQLIFLAGGEASTLAKVQPILQVMGGKVLHAGENGAGAATKLLVNAMFGIQLSAMAELIPMVSSLGIAPEAAVEAFSATPVCSPAAAGAAGAMLNRQWQPAFPIDLVAKDFSLLQQTGESVKGPLPVTTAVSEVFASACKEGFGGDNITGIIQRYLT